MKPALLCVFLLLAGCGAPARQNATPSAEAAPPPQRSPQTAGIGDISASDPCANRLHDICGALLLYHFANQRLPSSLDELNQLPGFENLQLKCPVSAHAYVYNPIGILEIQRNERVIIYDPAPTHDGWRRGISIVEPGDDKALVTEVVILPESFFILHPPIK